MGEVIGPKHAPPRILHLPELWADVKAGELEAAELGRSGRAVHVAAVVQNVRLGAGAAGDVLRVTMEPSRLAVQVGTGPPILDEALYMRIYVGSNADDDVSIWEVQDRRVVVFHLCGTASSPATSATRRARGGRAPSSPSRRFRTWKAGTWSTRHTSITTSGRRERSSVGSRCVFC